MKKSTERKTENLHFRLTKREKKLLCKVAEEQGMSLSDYIRELALGKQTKGRGKANNCNLVVQCQEMMRYVSQKYGREEDAYLVELEEKVWKLLK